MNPTEAAALIVKTAIENKVIAFDDNNYPNTPAKEAQNEFNAKQIKDFYERIFKATNQKTKESK